MNKFQLTVLIAALANLALMLIFPPFNGQSLLRAGPASFDAFYPAFDAPANATRNSGLLYLEIFSVLVNAVLAWLLLQSAPQELPASEFVGRACCSGWSSPICC